MAVSSSNPLDYFKERLDALVASYQRPEERRIGYGNLRHEYSDYSKDGSSVNIAVIYETPGGSTTQLNITYDQAEGTFVYLDRNLENHISSTSPEDVLANIEAHVADIPEKRSQQVINQVDLWMKMGKGRHEIFGELNKLLQTEFLGGRITTNELKEGIQHVVQAHGKAG